MRGDKAGSVPTELSPFSFCRKPGSQHEPPSLMFGKRSVSMSIPVISIADLQAPASDQRQNAERALIWGLGEFGLVYVQDHPVAFDTVGEMYEGFRKFCDQPVAKKQALARPDLWFQRGWTPPNTEVAVASGGQPDFKECYFSAPHAAHPASVRAFPKIYPPNVWPKDGTEWERAFEHSMLTVGAQLHQAGLAILQGCARGLGLDENAFTNVVERGAHVTRAIKYLSLTQAQIDAKVLWGEEHTDFNLLTLLPGGVFYNPSGKRDRKPDDRSGLFLRTRPTAKLPQGEHVRGTGPEGCITVQVGQELEILTGGRFHATPHVITAPGVPDWTRLSSAHFIHADALATLYPLAPFQNEATEREYGPPVLAGTYATKTLVDIGLAPKEEIERFGYRHYERLNLQRES
jgi:isopenicillin N synthase-like dioxygenase